MKNTTDTVFYCNERSEMEVNMEQSFHYQLMAVQSLVQKKILEQLQLTENEQETLEHIAKQTEEETGLDRAAAIAQMRFRINDFHSESNGR